MENFDLVWSRFSTYDEQSKGDLAGIRAQLQEFIDYMNDIGAKLRLFSAKISRNPIADAEGDTTLWEALSEMANDVRMAKGEIDGFPQALKEFSEQLEKQACKMQKMDLNTNKLYTYYKGHLALTMVTSVTWSDK
jgi:hypothetical protein